MPVSGRFIFAAFVVGLLAMGVMDLLTNFEPNGCEMTWMFEMPEYVNVKLSKKVSSAFPRYKLYLYGEGFYAKQLSSLKLQGIPVLFIPGNAGSYKQVRSLGSVAHSKSENKLFHFNYFSVDLNEEFSALLGSALKEQTEFVHACLKKIMSIYKNAKKTPKSVILVGHSMGGMIARALFTLPGFNPSTVSTIITQATPHQGPVLTLDVAMAEFYRKVNSYWREHGDTTLKHVLLVSTGGGFRDILVPNWLTSLKNIAPPERSVSTSTMSVPLAWVSTDHLCAVWCRQLVLVTKRALFDIVDRATKQVATDVGHRMKIFESHFLRHPGWKRPVWAWNNETVLNQKTKWNLKTERSWVYRQEKVSAGKYLAVPIHRNKDYFIVISNVIVNDWVCACKLTANEERCSNCTNLSHKGKALPPLYSYKKFILLNLKELEEFSHIVLIVPINNPQVEISVEFFSTNDRHLLSPLPSWSDLLIAFSESIVLKTTPSAVFYKLRLSRMESLLNAFQFVLKSENCKSNQSENYEGSLISFMVPWGHEDTHTFVPVGETGSLSLKLQSTKPFGFMADPELHLFLDSSCTYKLHIKWSLQETLGQFIRFYGYLLPAFCVANLLLALASQLSSLASDGHCQSTRDSLWATKEVWFFLLAVMYAVRFLLGFDKLKTYRRQLYLPEDDTVSLAKKQLWAFHIPLVLSICSLAMVIIHTTLTRAFFSLIIAAISLLQKLACNPASIFRISIFLGYLLLSAALLVSATICGTLGMLLVLSILLIKVVSLGVAAHANRDRSAESKFNFHLTLLLLWTWMLMLNAPAVLSWIRVIRFSPALQSDPSHLIGILGTAAIFILNVTDLPSDRLACIVLTTKIYLLSIVLLLYSVESLYRISYVIVAVLMSLGLSQLLAAWHAARNRKIKQH